MSYILNALRKSELQRQQSQSEKLENKILQPADDKAKKTSAWIVSLVLINFILLAYFIWSLNGQSNQESSKLIKPTVSDQQEKNSQTELPAATKLNKTIKETQETQQFSIAELMTKQTNRVKSSAKLLERKQLPAWDATKKSTIEPEIKKPVIVDVESSSEHSIIAKTIKPIETTVNQIDKTNDIPFLSELDYSFRRSVPALNINVFVYSEKKADRFIMVNMQKYKPGQQMVLGMKLIEIRIDSIVVEFEDRKFQIVRK